MIKNPEEQIVWLSENTERRYSAIVESRHLVVFPWMLDSILARTPSKVLDYGGGDGKFLLGLREHFEGDLSYFDPSRTLKERATRCLRDKGILFFESPQSIRSESMDLIVSIAVWMTINTYDGCIQYLRSQYRILKRGGCAMIAVTHPCFREEIFSSFRTTFSNLFYHRDGFPFEVAIFDDHSEVRMLDYHWNLSTMLRQAFEVGFRLIALNELPDSDEETRRGTPWLCFEFVKD